MDSGMYRTCHESRLASIESQMPSYTLQLLYKHSQASKHEQEMRDKSREFSEKHPALGAGPVLCASQGAAQAPN